MIPVLFTTFNRLEFTKQTLPVLLKNTLEGKIIVIDNGSENEDYKNVLVETYIYEIIDVVSWYKSNEYKKNKKRDYYRSSALWEYLTNSKSINYNLLLQSVESGNFVKKVFEIKKETPVVEKPLKSNKK